MEIVVKVGGSDAGTWHSEFRLFFENPKYLCLKNGLRVFLELAAFPPPLVRDTLGH